jgi:histidine phosphotransfer protein HptB
VSDPVIDPATFAALQDMAGPEFADELVGTFLEEAPTMLADLRASDAAREAERYRRAAHSLKSNSLTFGALTLAAMAKALELGGIAERTSSEIDALDAEYARVVDALKALRHG